MYWLLRHVLVGPWVRAWCRARVDDAARMPHTGPAIVVANHESEIDSLLLGAYLPARLVFLAKHEYFQGRLAGSLYGVLCRLTGQIAVDRGGGDPGRAALEAAARILTDGGVWAIYPEGTRSRDGKLHRGHTGVARVALRHTTATIVPVGLRGTPDIDSPDHRGWRRGRVQIIVGEPVDLSAWHGRADDPAAWREATDHIMECIRRLSGQEYVDSYTERPCS